MPRRFDPVHLGSARFKTLERGPFLVTDAWFPPGLELTPHEHERPVVAVTLEGGWDSVMLRVPYDCIAGTLLVEPAGERHSNHFGSSGGRVMVIQPLLSRVEDYEPVRGALAKPISFASPHAASAAARLRQEIEAPDALSPIAVEALCLELLVAAGRQAGRRERIAPRWLKRVVEYLHANARESLTIAGIAAVGGVHPAHLAKEFRRHHGTSVASYVRRLRLAWAHGRLAASEDSIAGIALDAGFADQSHFTRAFRRYSGLTPRAFRDRLTDEC